MITVNNDSEGFGDPQTNLDTLLLTECATVLQKHYPDHYWSVTMPSDKSVIQVRCLNVSSKLGIVIHTKTAQNDPDKKCVVRAGGELLERAGLVRGRCVADPVAFDVSNSANVLDRKYHNNSSSSRPRLFA